MMFTESPCELALGIAPEFATAGGAEEENNPQSEEAALPEEPNVDWDYVSEDGAYSLAADGVRKQFDDDDSDFGFDDFDYDDEEDDDIDDDLDDEDDDDTDDDVDYADDEA